ncbi:glycosyltransferase [Paenibacillus qinlingensis]|uniref:Glycosyltransferase involved in cell wall biosynthesis n=1 Tax=Paenibacillus qinlingensis TaxID=1837343 RepID=A0ABU1NXH8_9BACL|nr:glycosyltransferase [Paenibacillus qinlingensis]MDR6552208.1 glycosyltransferase involved in cell wall biosynthesis [Paenibacillus qinlingensis]
MKRILIISPDIISKKMAGPGIRYWNFAIELSKYYSVVLMTPNKSELTHESFSIEPYSKRKLKKIMIEINAIVLQGLTLFKNQFLKYANIPLIIDLYDPFVLEMLEERTNPKEYNMDLKILIEQLRFGDYFICASEKQKDFWIGMLVASKRINLTYYKTDKDLTKMIGVVPFGISNLAPIVTRNPFSEDNRINENDRIILWGGGIWNWLDPVTLIKAFHELKKEITNIKLYFMGVKHPNGLIEPKEVMRKMSEIITMLEIDENDIIFNDWVAYEDRQNYYSNATIGVTTHYENLETRFSFRTRVLDYIWCELPMVLTQGDYLSNYIAENDCGSKVTPENIGDLKNEMKHLLLNNDLYLQQKSNFVNIKPSLYWQNCTADLIDFCNTPLKKVKLNLLSVILEKQKDLFLKLYYIVVKLPKIWNKLMKNIPI